LPTRTLKVLGRSNDAMWFRGAQGGWVSLLPTPTLVLFMEVPGLHQYQIIQQAHDKLHVRFIPENFGDSRSVAENIRMLVQKHLEHQGAAPGVEITTEAIEVIERDKVTNKIKQIINMAGPPPEKS